MILAVVFVSLGLWQLDRLGERRALNEQQEQRLSAPRADLESLLEVEDDPAEVEYRRVIAEGAFDVDSEVLIRSQVYRGTAGFHVVTPLVRPDGTAVLVNRGWVPLPMDTVPVTEASPMLLESRVEGWVHQTQTRPALGPRDPADGVLTVMSRVDIDRIQSQLPYPLDPVYVVLESPSGDLPVPAPLPDFNDDGPHLIYAVQWFGFTVVLVVGFFALARRGIREAS